MKHSRLLAPTAFLIIYGSLYPFNFSPAAPDALAQLFFHRKLLTSTGDILGNVVLFAPLGLLTMLSWVPRWGLTRAATGAVLGGFVLALGLQLLQIFLPTRDAALADVLWGMIGMISGALAGGYIAKWKPELTAIPPARAIPLCLLAGLVVIEWLPLVPSLDLQLLKMHLRLLWSAPIMPAAPLWQGIGVAILAGYLLSSMFSPRQSAFWLVLFLVAISVGKLFIEDMPMEPSAWVGLVLGGLGWGITQNLAESRRRTLVWLVLFLCYTASAFQPYQLRSDAAPISWLPFATMLEGSMLHNVRSLAGNLMFYGGILYVGAVASGRLASATLGLALWVLVVELIQSLIVSRSADITEPLLVLLVGQTLASFQQHEEVILKGSAPASYFYQPKNPTGFTTWLVQAGMAAGTIILGITALLSLPGIPYNLRELFRADASLPALFSFSMALLWAGAGSVWLGVRLTRARRPGLQMLPLTLLVSIVSLIWLWAGVTTESIEDITGSANRFWFVTQQEVWGSFWKDVFLLIKSPYWIGTAEHIVRFSALYAPLPIFLSLLIVLRQSPWRGQKHAWRVAELLLSAGALLWLCKAIAFDWTSTDNLNELIARDGEWGWGGGGFLYALLLLLCINGLLLAEATSGAPYQVIPVVVFSLTALPLGWWLLNHGLEQSIQKYGLVFSGTQFLLGEDRQHLLNAHKLFVRWCGVQAGATLILAMGIWLGQSAGRQCRMLTLRRTNPSSPYAKAT